VQVLLAGNLIVFGISDVHQLGVPLAALVVLFGVLLMIVAIWMRRRSPAEGHGEP